ncbi:MAG: HD domain-containing protein [Tissierellia bacterium]|nr:HD domain-containing protein [Tissierellia bacterium]
MIRDFEVGERIEGFYLIRELNLRTSSSNNKYFDLTLADASGQINSKIWNIQDGEEKLYSPGDIVKIRGDVTLWMEQLQLKIIKHRPKRDDDKIDYKLIISSAPYEGEDMWQELHDRAQKIEKDSLKKMALGALDYHKDKLLYYPAAKSNHHAIRSGLLYHLLRMYRAGDMLAELYGLDKDLLFTGVLYHDLEKITEMDSDEMGIVSTYTKEGILLGHIISGIGRIKEIADSVGCDDETRLLLQHMVLSHHYEAEYGSPKKPMFPEAELLHYLDIMDARIYDMQKASSDIEEGEFSSPIFSLGRRVVYKPIDNE